MDVQRSISACAEAMEDIRLLVSSKRWKSYATVDEAFSKAFSQLEKGLAGKSLAVNDHQALIRLEQQVRRVQRDIRREMGEISEKLHWLDTEQNRTLKTHQHLDSSV